MIINNLRFFEIIALLSVFFLLFGCASTEKIMRTDADPLEPYNRFMFRVNDTLDKTILKPAAQGYNFITPQIINQGVTNFFNNLGEIIVIANDILQLKPKQAVMDTSRFVYNTTFGLLGFFDVATHFELPKNEADFGLTLGHWGVGEGYFLVLPLLGPSTTRDVWSVPVDRFADPVTYVDPLSTRIIIRSVDLVNTRSDLLRVERAFADTQIDPYSFQRQAYLQKRRNLVYDGNPPELELEFDDLEDFDDFDDLDDLDESLDKDLNKESNNEIDSDSGDL